MASDVHSYTAQIDVLASSGPVLLLKAEGHINTRSAVLFEANAFRMIRDADTDVVIEASGIAYLSTAGIRVFLRLWRELKQKGRTLYICNLKPYIRQVFELLGFDKVISIQSDVDSALDLAASRPS